VTLFILEKIILNHLHQLESNTPKNYKAFLYGWTLKYLRLSARNEFAGETMRRLYAVASELDGFAHSTYREVRRVVK